MHQPTEEEITQAMDTLLVEIAAYTETARQYRLARAHYSLGEPLSMPSLWPLLRWTPEEVDGA